MNSELQPQDGSGDDDMDPMSAVGAANALAKTTNTLTKNSVFQALFLPVAKAYGDHWGREAREKLKAAASTKAQDNVLSHLEAVRRHAGEDFKPDPSLTAEWLDGVEKVDPADKELSAAWQGVMLAIGSGNIMRSRLLRVVKELTPEIAHSFIVVSRRRYNIDTFIRPPIGIPPEDRRRLVEMGLVKRPSDLLTSPNSIVFILLVMWGLISGFTLLDTYLSTPEMGGPDFSSEKIARIRALSIVVVVGPIIGGLAVLFGQVRLTALGEELRRFILRARTPQDAVATELSRAGEGEREDGGAPSRPPTRRRRSKSTAETTKGGSEQIA